MSSNNEALIDGKESELIRMGPTSDIVSEDG